MKRIGSTVVTKHVPDRGPPAAGAKQVRDLLQSKGFFEPMKSGGTQAKVIGFLCKAHPRMMRRSRSMPCRDYVCAGTQRGVDPALLPSAGWPRAEEDGVLPCRCQLLSRKPQRRESE